MATSIISSKGQTTIPVAIQRFLKVKPGDKIQYFVEPDGRVSLLPKTLSVKDLKDVLPKPPKCVSIGEMDAAVRDRAANEFIQRSGK
jgi:bifunctional DNA-binding transcriptional regulator/antitoxin component of YhaV-PrlF toxin-antitoxin module